MRSRGRKSYEAFHGRSLGIIAFAAWGLGPLLRACRILFLQKNDNSWAKSKEHQVMTSYIQPLLLWGGVVLICRPDLLILKRTKESIETRDIIFHGATIYTNALMHVRTTVDTFLRENMDWLSKATNWAKFGATTGLGVIHSGHLKQGRLVMVSYLPQNGSGGGSRYSEGNNKIQKQGHPMYYLIKVLQ
ncbi:26S proteasome non-ATPase regulatory subunit 1 homolog A-like protein [Tanacetum coccineum]